ncbi:hypothetical protein SAMN05216532_0015 [Streptomyces sp. 2231.1]|nr:hypothetical protein SAMN05216532_0015 [Streptomyces sp. 2231.1]
MMPPVVAAASFALALICGCHRTRTSRCRRSASSGRGVRIWFFTYRSTVRWLTPSSSATRLVLRWCWRTR